MSRENVEVVRRMYAALNRGDLDTASSCLHPDIELHTYANAPEAGIYRGKEAVLEYNQGLYEQFESVRVEIEESVDAGDRVVVAIRQHAVPKGGGHKDITVNFAEVWAIRSGLLAKRYSYSSKDQALEAVGLRV